MNPEIIKLAAEAMHVEPETAEKNCKEIPEHGLYYFWNPVRGGIAVLINESGEKLAAGSAVRFERHLQAFLDGRRN